MESEAYPMEIYKPRKVDLHQLAVVNGWRVKVYTITHKDSFTAHDVLETALINLPHWLETAKKISFPTYHSAFLIVHEGRDGIWTLFNCWMGGEMLHSLTFFTNFAHPDEFTLTPKEGFMTCVWEMAVISFERAMWVEYILKKANQPDFTGYWQTYLSKEV